MRRAAKVDTNQPEIVALFRKLNWTVLIISQLKNCADIIVSKNSLTIVIEIKDGSLAPSKQKLTSGEEKFRRNWQGVYRIVNCENDVIELNNQEGEL